MMQLTLPRLLLGMIVAGCSLLVLPGHARTTSIAVYESGQVRVFSGARPASAAECDEGLLFEFTESADPAELNLSRREDPEEGSINLEVRITSVCEQVADGQAALQYEHRPLNGGQIGADIEISGLISPVVLQLSVGNSVIQQVNYRALGNSGSNHEFEMAGNQISFSGGGVFGSTSRQRRLATITVAGVRFVDTPGLELPGNERERDAARTLDDACVAEAATPQLRQICEETASAPPEVQLQTYRALDPHELAAVPSSATEMGQIQTTNLGSRLAALRGGATGISLGGLSLSYNGMRFDRGLLPASLLGRIGEGDSGTTLFDQRWGVFVNGEISIGKRDERGKEVGFDFDTWGLTAGIDYRFDPGHVVGVAVGYSDYSASLDDDGGKLDSDTWSVMVFGSATISEAVFLDLTLGRGWQDFDQQRVIDLSGLPSFTRQTAIGSTKATQWTGSAAINYRMRFDNGWQVTPYGQFRYTFSEIDAFSETGGSEFALEFPDQKIASRIWSAGTRVSRPVNLAGSVMVPFIDLAYEHETGKDSFAIETFFVNSRGVPGPLVEINDPDRHFMRADIGASWVFVGGMQAFVNYSALLFESDTTRHSFFAGLRWEF
jgi:outer membrane autotransporter protein